MADAVVMGAVLAPIRAAVRILAVASGLVAAPVSAAARPEVAVESEGLVDLLPRAPLASGPVVVELRLVVLAAAVLPGVAVSAAKSSVSLFA